MNKLDYYKRLRTKIEEETKLEKKLPSSRGILIDGKLSTPIENKNTETSEIKNKSR